MIIPIELEVTIEYEYLNSINLARVDLTESKIERIKKLSRIVKRNKVANIADYDGSVTYLYRVDETDPDTVEEPEDSTECDMIVVTDSGFHWKGYIRHSGIRIETESMSIKALDELIKFYKETPLNLCPKYLNEEDYSKREIAKRRMQGLSPSMD